MTNPTATRPPTNALICDQCDHIVLQADNPCGQLGHDDTCPECLEGNMDEGWVFPKGLDTQGRNLGRPKAVSPWLNEKVSDWSEYWHHGVRKYVLPAFCLG